MPDENIQPERPEDAEPEEFSTLQFNYPDESPAPDSVTINLGNSEFPEETNRIEVKINNPFFEPTEGIILPKLSLEEIDTAYAALRAEIGRDAKFLILDNNPFNGVPADQVSAELEKRPWLRVVDHHGYYNDGVERSTFPRLADELESLGVDGFLSQTTRLITDQGNLDPDGILSYYLAINPAEAIADREFLTEVAKFTDFTMFGGEKITPDYSTDSAVKRFSYALLQVITEGKETFVERQTSKTLTELSADEIREIFVSPDPDRAPVYDSMAVQEIYLDAIYRHLPLMLQNTEELPEHYQNLADKFEERLRYSADRARDVTQASWGADAEHPDGKIAYLTPDTGYTARLDKGADGFPIYDWLAESVSVYVTDAPVNLKVTNGFYVISVRHAREGETRDYDYNMNVVTELINEHSDTPLVYGRKEVSLGFIPESVLTTDQVIDLLKENWDRIATPIH